MSRGGARAHRGRALRLAFVATLATVSASSMAGAAAQPTASAPTEQRCFGAASRDTVTRCRNPALRLVVSPAPTEAVVAPPAPCVGDKSIGLLYPCRFGVGETVARDSVALVGDSHAGHWRAAVNHVALERGWTATSMTMTGCGFSMATRAEPGPKRTRCTAWNKDLRNWFRDHPEVHTIFVSANATVKVLQKGASSQFVARRNGFTRAWELLPRTVKRIIVLRDVQSRALSTLDCIERAMAKKRPPGTSCAVRRTSALRPDSQASAARSFKRARVADLSAFSCGRRLCLPVVGGALVNKDRTHMTTTFAKTLGPYLLRQVETFGPFPGERAPSAMGPTGATGSTGATGTGPGVRRGS